MKITSNKYYDRSLKPVPTVDPDGDENNKIDNLIMTSLRAISILQLRNFINSLTIAEMIEKNDQAN